MSGGPKRGAKTELAIAALLTHHTFDEAAAAVGVCKRTLMRWLQTPDFRAQYLEARRQIYSQAIGLAQQALSEGVTVLRGILNDGGATTSSRVAAFSRLDDMSRRGIEIEDMETRLSVLEQRAAQAEQ